MSDLTIGVLGLQGAVEEHVKQVESLGIHAIIVKRPSQLNEIDGLIFPGGESTTMRKLIDQYGFFEPLIQFSKEQKPIFGTCAGMVLLAKDLEGSEVVHLGLMDIVVKRNAFGRQRESFEADLEVAGFDSPFHAVFIRAPYIKKVGGGVEILAEVDGHIVAARQGHLLTTAFHPELTEDSRFLELFVEMVNESKSKTFQKA
ncbi:pyridoxal 5'-phosphate synthase glutaminase subunit PdxT [Caldifermentibacillus hisashii]|uniref:pyridoxal 5'-phosphate synthase glutaminase subunit PdxT n=1 Tax=Caldifermentibacillus hisashii TaxID=996558 RepID=UPI002E1D6B70|nr:pyridoxal 5'-phosphate synthase glutaminase subunit PdxT [Caldifermentibacillus hisashii]MED3642533.1 pyridoxal 5'-phosphate synthase glutaminase subunit PdxT [Caldifermentibacillus hisashii]